jgi:hypothetical protein
MNIRSWTSRSPWAFANDLDGEGALVISGGKVLTVISVWILLSALAGVATVSAAKAIGPGWERDPSNVIPVVVVGRPFHRQTPSTAGYRTLVPCRL